MFAIYGRRNDDRLICLRDAMRTAGIPCALIGPELGFVSLAERVPFVCFTEESVPIGEGLRAKLPPEKVFSLPDDVPDTAVVDLFKLAYYRRFGEDIEFAAAGPLRFAENRVFFRANLLCLTKNEYLILRLLFHSRGAYFTAEEIAVACLADGRGGVAVHICNINRKARGLLQIPLIETRRRYGYRIV